MTHEETIGPTHECFDDLVDFLNDLAERGAPREVLMKYTVVHGICLMPPNGEPRVWTSPPMTIVDAWVGPQKDRAAPAR